MITVSREWLKFGDRFRGNQLVTFGKRDFSNKIRYLDNKTLTTGWSASKLSRLVEID